jgi:hypothetical protein
MINNALLLVGISALLLSACAVRDSFPMRNPDTGQEITCHSGWYVIEEGVPQMRIATQCIRACERYGFRRFTGNPYADQPHPAAPDDAMRPEIPIACLS